MAIANPDIDGPQPGGHVAPIGGFVAGGIEDLKKADRAARAGSRYLLVHIAGGSLLFAGILVHVAAGGDLEITALTETTTPALAFWLILIGVAINAVRPVGVVDGDGAALMKLGSLATIGAYRPENLVHMVLDNGTYDSTGGQPTTAASVDFAAAARACGYNVSVNCDDLTTFDELLGNALKSPGPHMVHVRIKPGSMSDLGRPTVTPPEVARRFKAFVAT